MLLNVTIFYAICFSYFFQSFYLDLNLKFFLKGSIREIRRDRILILYFALFVWIVKFQFSFFGILSYFKGVFRALILNFADTKYFFAFIVE